MFSPAIMRHADAPRGGLDRLLRIVLLLFGLVCCGIALAHIALGTAAIPGAIPVNTTVDSEDRIYGALFLFFGLAVIWASRAPAQRGLELQIVLMVFFGGGLARIIAAAMVGPPARLFVVLGAFELALPLALIPTIRANAVSVPSATPAWPAPASVSRALRWVTFAFGLCCCVIAGTYVALGGAAIPGGSPLNPTMDSEVRFYAVFFLAYGIAVCWAARDLPARRGLFTFLLAAFFCGGLARMISAVMVGPPSTLFMSQTAVELALPIILWGWLERSMRGGSAKLR